VFLLYYVAFLMVLSCILQVIVFLLILVRLKWCDLRNYRGGGSHASRVKFLSGNGGIVIVCRYIIAV
jgi:hypothetical protein